MTSATIEEVARRKGAPRHPRTMAASLGAALIARGLELGARPAAHAWPSSRWEADPVGFARTVLGVELWARQIEILESARDHKRTAIAGGRKIGKDYAVAVLALWWFCSFPDARVIVTATTERQIDGILYREIKKLLSASGRCLECKRSNPRGPRPCRHSHVIEEHYGKKARTGISSLDLREIVGFTARQSEAVQGISGGRLLYVFDEASGIDDDIFVAVEGNQGGGSRGNRLVLISNPTREEGEFYEAFHGKAEFYHTLTVSSEESPNVVEGRDVIPGLADRPWIDEMRKMWGADSAFYQVHVLGKFSYGEATRVLTVHAIGESERRWPVTPADGRLCIGIDPAGPGMKGDETAFAARRGQKQLSLFALLGLSEPAILAHLLGILKDLRRPHETEIPLVVVDREGPIGTALYRNLRAYVDEAAHAHEFAVLGVKASDRAQREPQNYDRVSDELWANLAQWVRDGGALLSDVKLAKDLHAPEWIRQINGRLKVTPKSEVRKLLGRSPDRADAVALSVWGPQFTPDAGPGSPDLDPDFDERPALDPYSAQGARGGR